MMCGLRTKEDAKADNMCCNDAIASDAAMPTRSGDLHHHLRGIQMSVCINVEDIEIA